MNQKAAAVGRLLFYDKILSGNRNISCATCHERELGTSDGLSLGIGEGGVGLGPKRTTGEGSERIERRVPRNSPALWNLGARGVDTLFHDGRVQFSVRFGNGFDTPVDGALPQGLMSILAAQALMPVLSDVEMAGNPAENEIARAGRRRPQDAWALLAARVEAIETYDILLRDAYPEIEGRLRFEHIANAIGEFLAFEYQSYDSPYDVFLAGDTAALTADQKAGLRLFFGKAGCSGCHSGHLLSDQDFHALALPPLGPGRTRRFDPRARDLGRMNETDRIEDAYRFRTPMLRNVALTAPYGHNGTYPTLEGIVRHHLDPVASLETWSRDLVSLPSADWLLHGDYQGWEDAAEMARLARQVDIEPLALSDTEVDEIVAFLNALTGTESVKGHLGRPDFVPSGLSVD
ncbi:cytochrome-c peroxidase [Halovulum sp. GXIMD14793]